jgi:hypothetical protein
MLGGWLAQRQAALRGKLAAGARFNFTLVSRACRGSLEHSLCHRKRLSESRRLLVVRSGVGISEARPMKLDQSTDRFRD